MYSLSDAIIQENIQAVQELLRYGVDVNEIDEYGFTPLIEAAIADNIQISELLLNQGAFVNGQDMTGGTALHWAVENSNIALCRLLLDYGANPNASNIGGQPVLAMPLLRQQTELKKLLTQHGASIQFAQDYVNTKSLGHMFELVGSASILNPSLDFIEVDFEGFYLEVTLALIAESLTQFNNHYAARNLRNYIGLIKIITDVIQRAAQLIKFQQYRVDIKKHSKKIEELIKAEPLLIPVAYEGHAITFIKVGNILVKCDRREDSRLYDNIVFYQMNYPEGMTVEFIKTLMYEKKSFEFINEDVHQILDLAPLTELKIPAQISGNCSWANVEAVIPTLFFLMRNQVESLEHIDAATQKSQALKFFEQWREWNKDRSLHFCISSMNESTPLRKLTKAEILMAILFQRCMAGTAKDTVRADMIMDALDNPIYDHIIQNYIRTYSYEDYAEEGKRFLQWIRHKKRL